jgi:internalin A
MPRAEDLPESLRMLARLRRIEISDSRFDRDFERLAQELSNVERRIRERRALHDEPRNQGVASTETTQATDDQRPEQHDRLAYRLEEARGPEEPSDVTATTLRYYVSYARADASDPDRELGVDRLCEEAKRRGIDVLRDKKDLHQGELISTFMKRLGEGDRVFIFLSDKYLRSPYCMYELFELWCNSNQDERNFLRHVRVFSIDGVQIRESSNRLEYTKVWIANRDGLRKVINDIGWRRSDCGI